MLLQILNDVSVSCMMQGMWPCTRCILLSAQHMRAFWDPHGAPAHKNRALHAAEDASSNGCASATLLAIRINATPTSMKGAVGCEQ
jgi:hypothetical protein